jgi:hypothetical protein
MCKKACQAAMKTVQRRIRPGDTAGGTSRNWQMGMARRHWSPGRNSQLLALLVDAKRGEMVVDLRRCRQQTRRWARHAHHRPLYAFDTSAHRLAALKPRLARSSLSNVHPVAIAHARRPHQAAGRQDRPGAGRAVLGAWSTCCGCTT